MVFLAKRPDRWLVDGTLISYDAYDIEIFYVERFSKLVLACGDNANPDSHWAFRVSTFILANVTI